ncbi:MAG: CPBP family glutamic-type intramembrane protease [Gemmatimonadales bacterium]
MNLEASPIGLPGAAHLLVFALLLPLAAMRTRHRLRHLDLPSRRAHFLGVLAQQLLFLLASLWVAAREGILLFPRFAPSAGNLILGAAVTTALVLTLRGEWRRSVEARTRAAYLFMPWDAAERGLWLSVAAAAAVAEEVTYRAVAVTLFGRLVGSPVLAVTLAAAAFGFAHGVQGPRSAIGAVGAALIFHGLVFLTGGLYVAIAVHFAYDLIAGLCYARLGKALGYPRDGFPPENPEPRLASA